MNLPISRGLRLLEGPRQANNEKFSYGLTYAPIPPIGHWFFRHENPRDKTSSPWFLMTFQSNPDSIQHEQEKCDQSGIFSPLARGRGEKSVSKPNSRDLILKAALQEFAEKGYDRTTVDSIAQSSHVAKGSVYYHFSSKEAIWTALFESKTQRLLEITIQSLNDHNTLPQLLCHWIDFFWEEQDFLGLFLSEAWRDREREKLVGEFLNQLLQPVAAYIPEPHRHNESLAYALFGSVAVPTLHILKSEHPKKSSLYQIAQVIAAQFA